jgi:hypothetical protein
MNINVPDQLTLTLHRNEVNFILQKLGKLPFEKSFQIIGKIEQQAMAQAMTPIPEAK